jgi:HSP20 family protein
MPKRNDITEQGQRDQQRNAGRNTAQSTAQSGRENVGSRQSGQVQEESRGDRERGLRTEREPHRGSGMVRQKQPGPGLSGGYVVTPFSLVSRMLEDMDRMLEGFGGTRARGQQLGGQLSPFGSGLGGGLSRFDENIWAPAVEMFQKKDKLVIRADLPGLSKDDVEIEIADDTLIIQGERRHEQQDEEEGFYRSERSYGQFFRMIPLPDGIDADKADAKFKDGTLEITLPAPRHEEKRSRKLSIK